MPPFNGPPNASQAAFETLKTLLVNAPILAYPQFQSDYPFILETDASKKGLSAVTVSAAASRWESAPNRFASLHVRTHLGTGDPGTCVGHKSLSFGASMCSYY